MLYLIEILHQTTTERLERVNADIVVSYRNSTSNHNKAGVMSEKSSVVSYRNSTSNHNEIEPLNAQRNVVSYRNSTSNHNSFPLLLLRWPLYLIEILHQTTTQRSFEGFGLCCILSKFYIKPQLLTLLLPVVACCILSKFYIKPQQRIRHKIGHSCCILSKFYIKPQLRQSPLF